MGYADAGGYSHAFLYSGGSMHDLDTLPGDSCATGINDSGQIVGYRGGWAFLYSVSNGMQNLNSLIDPSSGWTLTDPTAINNNGQIVCNGHDPGGYAHAFLLTPYPNPPPSSSSALVPSACLPMPGGDGEPDTYIGLQAQSPGPGAPEALERCGSGLGRGSRLGGRRCSLCKG